MLPRKIPADMPEAERRAWRVVRLDKHLTLPGALVCADVDLGSATLREGDETKTYDLGPGGIAIIGR